MAKFRSTTDVIPAIYKIGERFAQLVIVPIATFSIEEAFELSNTERGENGYGSSGNQETVTSDEPISAAMNDQGSLEVNGTVTNPDVDESAAEQISSEQA